MKTFDDLVFVEEIMYGDLEWSRTYMMFDNGYGISVVRGPHSYGGKLGFYEIAVIDSDGFITYDTPITSDVIGFLKPEDVSKYMIEIQELPIAHKNKENK